MYGRDLVAEWKVTDQELANPPVHVPVIENVKFLIKDHLGNTRVAYKASMTGTLGQNNCTLPISSPLKSCGGHQMTENAVEDLSHLFKNAKKILTLQKPE